MSKVYDIGGARKNKNGIPVIELPGDRKNKLRASVCPPGEHKWTPSTKVGVAKWSYYEVVSTYQQTCRVCGTKDEYTHIEEE